MNIKKISKRSTICLSMGLALCLSNCDNGDDDEVAEPTIPTPVFEEGFNPETLQINSQVWMVGSDGSNLVSSVVSANTINYSYTFSGRTVRADDIPFTFTSLGKSASLVSNFNLTGNQSVYTALTAQLADSNSPLSVALAALDANDDATVAEVIKAAGDASPGLILFARNGLFYTLDSLELDMGDSNQGRQTLVGTPILFANNIAEEGTGSPRTQVSTVEVSYRNSFH